MKIHYLDLTTSTMDELKALARQGAPAGEVVVAERQTHGRGQQGHEWFGDIDSLMFSILFRPEVLLEDVTPLVRLVSEAVVKGVTKIVKVPLRMEWPNDLIIDNEKIGGILIESVSQGHDLHFAVAGIGLNVNNLTFPDSIKQVASSLRIKAEREIDKQALLDSIVYELRNIGS